MPDLVHDDIQAIREEVCEGCRGNLTDTDCQEYCDAFKAAAEATKQALAYEGSEEQVAPAVKEKPVAPARRDAG